MGADRASSTLAAHITPTQRSYEHVCLHLRDDTGPTRMPYEAGTATAPTIALFPQQDTEAEQPVAGQRAAGLVRFTKSTKKAGFLDPDAQRSAPLSYTEADAQKASPLLTPS